jgi:folate-dependent phosphoribosylglycinamide formyltransferase PurN
MPTILMIATDCISSRILYWKLSKTFFIKYVLIEKKQSSFFLIKKRLKKIGFVKVLGQIYFILFIVPILRILSIRRIKNIILNNNISFSPIPSYKITKINSVNDLQTIEVIDSIKPDIILINGTRIIRKNIINKISQPMLNMHVGITPKYRGVHGAYWALANNDAGNCGVTIHFIDEGIDTGKIIKQSLIEVSDKDNFITYPILQSIKGAYLIDKIIKEYNSGKLIIESLCTSELSNLYSHPTLLEYLRYRLKYGVK